MPHEVFDDLQKTTNIVFEDAFRIAQALGTSDDPWLRRSYVRSIFAAIEAITFGIKRVTLQMSKHRQIKLDVDELERLKEVRIDSYGKPQKRFLPFSDNIKFAFNVFAKVHGFHCVAQFGDSGWQAMLEAVSVRDRLMHPKSSQDLEVTARDIGRVQQAAHWYFTTRNHLVDRARLQIREHGISTH